MKYISIDVGMKKCGVAVSDDRGSIAMPFAIYKTEEVIKEILEIIKDERFQKIVIGESVNMKGEHNKIWDFTLKLAENLKIEILNMNKNDEENEADFNLRKSNLLEIIFEKEFFTSKHARVIDEEGAVDDRAAALTLQRYLDRQNMKDKKQKWHNINEDERRRAQEEINEAEENMC